MSTVRIPRRNRVLLQGADWQTYTRLLRAFAQRRSVRLTYDRGDLEIMSPLPGHENDAYLLGRFVDTLTEEHGVEVFAGRSTTFRRRKKQRGLEADNSYWIKNQALVRGKRRIDLRVDPPPDLAIEVDITRSSLDRMAIYEALRVAEVWRFDGQDLSFHVLGSDDHYLESSTSLAFPTISASDLMPFLALRGQVDDNELIRRFRKWLRQHLGTGNP